VKAKNVLPIGGLPRDFVVGLAFCREDHHQSTG
jgi:hypothetical protein